MTEKLLDLTSASFDSIQNDEKIVRFIFCFVWLYSGLRKNCQVYLLLRLALFRVTEKLSGLSFASFGSIQDYGKAVRFLFDSTWFYISTEKFFGFAQNDCASSSCHPERSRRILCRLLHTKYIYYMVNLTNALLDFFLNFKYTQGLFAVEVIQLRLRLNQFD